MTNIIEDEIQRIVASRDDQQNNQQQVPPGTNEQQPQPDAQETIHIHYFPDAIVILKEEDDPQVVASTQPPVVPQQDSFRSAYAFVCVSLVLIVATIALQLYCVANPPIATVTIIPKSQTVTLNGTMQLGRVLPPLTISQSQTTKATGTGHQDAKQAQACCAASVLAKNISAFTGGQDARTYTTVTHNDIHNISTVLKTTLAASMQGALQGELSPKEQLHLLPCSPTVSRDHQIGDEAKTVTVTVSQTCSAVAYNREELQTKATTFLATQARKKSGAGYSLFGTVRVTVTDATITHTPPTSCSYRFRHKGHGCTRSLHKARRRSRAELQASQHRKRSRY